MGIAVKGSEQNAGHTSVKNRRDRRARLVMMSDDTPPSGNGYALSPAQRKRVDGIVSSILLDCEGGATQA